jgi:hypothetical protein
MRAGDALKGELRVAWNRKLTLWWTHYNEEYLSQALKLPLIRIGSGDRELGHWDGTLRTLVISEAHIERDSWLAVMETLRHEMAHQYVQEVLKAEGEGPHGTAFKTACKRLRCSPRARATLAEMREVGRDGAGEEKVLRVLKKVISLADSPNEHEAQVAVQKARHLLVKYNIDLVELDERRRFDTRCLGQVKGRRASYEIWLASILNAFFFVEVIWAQSYDARRDRMGTVLQIFGTPANLEMAEYVYSYLLNLLDQLWEEYKVANGVRANRERQRYFVGVLEGFHRKLQAQEKTLRETRALVWKGDSKLQEYYRYLNPRVRTRYGGGVAQTRVYEDGVAEGGRVRIHRPVEGRGKGFGGHLKA